MSRVGDKTLVASGGWVRWSVTLAVAARVALFIGAIAWPIANERGARVSPLLSQEYFDFQFYLDSLHRYLASFSAVVAEFTQFYAGMVWRGFQLIAGPVFPLLLGASGYSSGHLLPLSLGYLVASSLLMRQLDHLVVAQWSTRPLAGGVCGAAERDLVHPHH